MKQFTQHVACPVETPESKFSFHKQTLLFDNCLKSGSLLVFPVRQISKDLNLAIHHINP